MFCEKCGKALPSHGFVCINCGAMMSPEQIKKQKEYLKENKDITLISDLYSKNPINRNYEKNKENKAMGIVVLGIILIILIILVILKVM